MTTRKKRMKIQSQSLKSRLQLHANWATALRRNSTLDCGVGQFVHHQQITSGHSSSHLPYLHHNGAQAKSLCSQQEQSSKRRGHVQVAKSVKSRFDWAGKQNRRQVSRTVLVDHEAKPISGWPKVFAIQSSWSYSLIQIVWPPWATNCELCTLRVKTFPSIVSRSEEKQINSGRSTKG